ncbi:fad binding domain protein [Diaporthe amygdali]|uniref:fad binding domain protein n=1 Tax=Phomopsis amygdali TaxID=1214568 RepID=UPI0022FF1E86|nr:fad binding domain protein [Diaporthe amygdali]KAJ0123642.1 fad binding domain protein [Diaporthe amygdali]
MEAHDAAVAVVAARVKHFHKEQKPFRNYHGSSLSTRPSDRNRDNIVDTSSLSHVLAIDKAKKTASVEPNVSMDVLVAATMKEGLVPQVVMELPSITVGGGFSGSSGESSSFRFGLFEATINGIEIVLPTGEVAKASNSEKQDLFWGAASAFGTIGVVTLLEVQLMDAKKYVAMTYYLTKGFDNTLVRIKEETKKEENDYIDGIAFTPESSVICCGRMVDDLPSGQKPRHFTRRGDPWFYLRVKDAHDHLLKFPENSFIDYIPLEDYLFRYDRGGFWTGRQAFEYFKVPFNRITRYVLDPFMYTRVINQAQAKTDFSYHYMIQDCGIPFQKCNEFKSWLDENIGLYPLWLCPLRARRDSPGSSHGIHAAMGKRDYSDLLNFGVWGLISWDRQEVLGKNKALEAKVRELDGWKTLYAHTYYSEEDFWSVYDRESYDAVRAKYGANYLPSVYEKVSVKVDLEAEEAALRTSTKARLKAKAKSTWPTRGLLGVYHAVRGGDVLLQKQEKPQTQKTASSGPGKA